MRSGTTTFGDYLRPFPGWGEIYRDAERKDLPQGTVHVYLVLPDGTPSHS